MNQSQKMQSRHSKHLVVHGCFFSMDIALDRRDIEHLLGSSSTAAYSKICVHIVCVGFITSLFHKGRWHLLELSV